MDVMYDDITDTCIDNYYIIKYLTNLSHLHARTDFDYNIHNFDYYMLELTSTTTYTTPTTAA